jgi:hypothetical protein
MNFWWEVLVVVIGVGVLVGAATYINTMPHF